EKMSWHSYLEILLSHANSCHNQAQTPHTQKYPKYNQWDCCMVHAIAKDHDSPGGHQQDAQTEERAMMDRHLRSSCPPGLYFFLFPQERGDR
ncbi:hypothetical protein GOODEAATRI_017017, partial [Goodea atripinnis]